MSFSKNIEKIKRFFYAHKILRVVISLLFLMITYYSYRAIFPTSTNNQYFLGTVERGNLILTVNGSGQVQNLDQVDLSPKGSGAVTYIEVTPGQYVSTGDLIAQLDTTNAEKTVRDAQINLNSANISLEKLEQPADTLSLLSARNSLSQAETSLAKNYDDGFNSVSNVFLNIPGIVSGLSDALYGTDASKTGQDNISYFSDLVKNNYPEVSIYKDSAANTYVAAKTSYDQTFLDYKAITRYSATGTIESLIDESYNTTKAMAEAVKSSSDFLNFVQNKLTERNLTVPQSLTNFQANLSSYTSQTNSDLGNLSIIRDNTISDEQSVEEKTASLNQLESGPNPLDVAASKLEVQQKQNALTDAKTSLENDYSVYAPFPGIIAKVNLSKTDNAGPSTPIATLITSQKIAQISLNEVDAAKVSVGDKATITFDAIEGLSMSGKVSEIDTLGTVTQGVVTYNIQIAFDTQDARVKPGMSLSASIITEVKPDVLLVPSSAIKTKNNTSYVQTLPQIYSNASTNRISSDIVPTEIVVTLGDSNDAQTEILSGLKEGNKVIVRTISASTKTSGASTAPSILNAVSGRATGGTFRGGNGIRGN